jgi:hypothetical protein
MVSVCSAPTQADTGEVPQVFFGGIMDFTTAFQNQGLPEVNRFRRGDSAFDNMRMTLFTDVVFSPRITLFTQVILDPTSGSSISSFFRPYARFTALETAKGVLHLEVGKLPTPFGSISPRAYSTRNPLVSSPLMYHYFTSLRSNQIPADNADLVSHRGQGPFSVFTGYSGGGASRAFNGLPLIYEICWDTGAQAIGSFWRFDYRASVTQGTLGDPRNGGGDNNDGKQFSGRLGLVPMTWLTVDSSYARGPYLHSDVAPALRQGKQVEDYHQKALGFDAAIGFRHLELIGELMLNTWDVPNIVDTNGREKAVETTGFYVQGKYAIRPGLYAAVRLDQIDFGEVDDGSGTSVPWDEPVKRIEFGVGYHFRDGVIGKVIRQDIRVEHQAPATSSHDYFWGAQLSLSF